ncbi:hypothetical protein [Nonomuraea sp. SBT364]|uniref:hypothetical protein n=1 Tax=Nonomuraea sp. SBT364 TaxID=1580530 RepID=UPI00066CC02C|nr:hypothetical protein [Nonomuraea sp. SBT364]
MADQFDVIEAGQRGRRRWIGLVVVLALLGVPLVSLLASRDPMPEPVRETAPIRSLTRVESAPNVLNAQSRERDGREVIEVVFPHGVRAEVRYPARLGLDRLGSRPFQGMWVDGDYRQLVAPYNGEIEVTKGGEPIRAFAPHVTLWPRQAGSGSYGQVLLFRFGRWRMAMYDRPSGLDFEQRMAVAAGVRGSVTDGYLVLSGTDRVRMAEPGESARGEAAGPQLWFGGGISDMVVLIPSCAKLDQLPRGVRGRGRPVSSVCRDGVRIAAAGDPGFVKTALDEIRITLK